MPSRRIATTRRRAPCALLPVRLCSAVLRFAAGQTNCLSPNFGQWTLLHSLACWQGSYFSAMQLGEHSLCAPALVANLCTLYFLVCLTGTPCSHKERKGRECKMKWGVGAEAEESLVHGWVAAAGCGSAVGPAIQSHKGLAGCCLPASCCPAAAAAAPGSAAAQPRTSFTVGPDRTARCGQAQSSSCPSFSSSCAAAACSSFFSCALSCSVTSSIFNASLPAPSNLICSGRVDGERAVSVGEHMG